MIQRVIAVVMILGSSMLTAWASGDIAFPAILCMLGLLGVQRRFAWDIRPERHFITPLLLLLLAILFALHCRYAHIRADQAAAFAWQTIGRYFLASMILLLFLRPHSPGARPPGRGTREGQRDEAGGSSDGDLHTSHVPQAPSCGLPASLGLFHLASVMAAGQVLLLDDRYVAFRLSELLSVVLVMLYAIAGSSLLGDWTIARSSHASTRSDAERRAPGDTRQAIRSPVLAFVFTLLLVAVNLGWIGGSLLFRHVEVINFLPTWLSRGTVTLEATTGEAARVGFSTSGKLSTVLAIKEDADTAAVLTITGNNPTYLRATAFETYNQSAWHDLSYREAIGPEQNMPLGVLLMGRTNLFRLREVRAEDPPPLREVTIRHESSVGDSMFTPLGTCFVEAPFPLMMRDDDDIVSSPNIRNRQSYRAGYTPSWGHHPPTGSQLRRMTAIPNQLDPRIRPSANRIFRGCTTTAKKIEAVTRYFHTNYLYALGLEVPADRDALNYFLLEASSGYCEYFASGAAILLRLAGVPTRYVTGFLVTERGDDPRTWVARNMDAHAWVEAWDFEQKQWVIVEATTQEGLDDASLADELSRAADSGRPFLTQLVQSLYEYGLFGVVGRLLVSHGLLTGAGLATAFLGAALIVARRSSRVARARRATGDERQATLHKLLAVMDRQAIRLGYRRQIEETLHAFAERIRRAACGVRPSPPSARSAAARRGCASGLARDGTRFADWYLQYADLRYGPIVDRARIEQLRQTAEELGRAHRVR